MNAGKRRYRLYARAASLLAAGLTAGAFAGGHRPGIELALAAGLLLGSVSLFLWSLKPSRSPRRFAAKLLGATAAAIGGIELLPLLFEFHAIPFAGSLPRHLFALLLLGLALAGLERTIPGKIRPAEYLAFLAGAMGLIAILSGIFSTGTLFHGNHDRVDETVALVELTLAVGILCARTQGGLMVAFVNRTPTARMLRRLILIIVVTLPLIGWLRLLLQRTETYSPELGLALAVAASLTVFILSILILGATLIKTEILRRQADHRRAMRETDFRATFEQAAVGLAHVSITGRFLRTNDRLSSILGYSRQEFARVSFQDITYPDDLAHDLDYFERVLRGEFSTYNTEKRYLKKDGSLVWANLTVALLRTPEGKPKYFISVIEDITNWKKAQEELEAASKAKDRFISIISHELRTPLTPVLAALSGNGSHRRLESIDDPDTIEMMRRNIEHEASIINDLLELTRISSSGKLKLSLQPVDLHALIHEIIQGLQNALNEKELSCALLLNAPRHTVHADPIRLRQVFLNLLDNAMKFTPPGGKITIETRISDPERIEIEVNDTGIGIAPGSEERIFQAFEQDQCTTAAQRRYGGLGLGLAIVRGLIEAHGGSIRAVPSATGATFLFELNLTLEEPRPLATARTGETPHLRILLVEDHADTRVTLQRLLERRGHNVRTATGVKDAAAIFGQHAFDLLISDIGLPDGSGLDLPTRLRPANPRLACIALSGFGTEEDIQKSLRAGFARHITKPVEMSILDAAIADLLRH